jgi:hypothetical protein
MKLYCTDKDENFFASKISPVNVKKEELLKIKYVK